MYHDWPVKKAVVELPIRLKGNLKFTLGNSMSPNKDPGAALTDMAILG